MYLVSACLAGVKCRFDGQAKPCAKVIEMVRRGEAIPVCPEQLGGLPTPRPAAEQRKGRIVTSDGKDMTSAFQHGADEALKIGLIAGCDQAILKSKSPSCGCGRVYDGTFTKKLVVGDGIFTQLMKKNGISVQTEEQI
jgi:uncharacterized protein YbbK (DUF523 family)